MGTVFCLSLSSHCTRPSHCMCLVGELVPLLQWRQHFHMLMEPGGAWDSAHTCRQLVGCWPPRSLPHLAEMQLGGPELTCGCGRCSWLAYLLGCREGSNRSRDSGYPVKEKSSSLSPTSATSSTNSSLDTYVYSFLCNHKSMLSGLFFFFPLLSGE